MVDDLVGSGHLDGLTRGEVVELLGPPYLVVDDSWRSARTFTYLLGVAILDAHLLEVTFDEDGTVASYRTYLS